MKRNPLAGQKPVFLTMQKHPGIVFTAETLAEEMNLDGNSVNSIGRAMVSLCAKGQIDRVGQGRYLYRKMPAKAVPVKETVAGNVYESIGLRKSTGNVIVKDVDNNLYELHEL